MYGIVGQLILLTGQRTKELKGGGMNKKFPMLLEQSYDDINRRYFDPTPTSTFEVYRTDKKYIAQACFSKKLKFCRRVAAAFGLSR